MTAPPLPGSLIDLFLEWAERIPHAPALIDGEHVLSYRALEIASRRAALDFRATGWQAGGVVGGGLGTMPFVLAVVAILGLGRAGIALLPLSAHEAGGGEAAPVLRRFGAVGLLAAAPPAAEPGVPVRLVDARWLAGNAPPPASFDGPVLRGLCLVIGRSSGTTGTPKAFAITHAQEAARMVLQTVPQPPGPGDREVTLAGLGFLTGVRCALRCLGSGATLVARPHTGDAEAILQAIDRHGVTHILGSPVHLRFMMGEPHGAPDAPRLPRLKVWRIGGSILAPSLLAEARARLTPAIHCSYGTNEAGSLTCATPEMLARHPKTVGKLYPGVELELRDTAGRPQPPGQAGRVWVRSPGVVTAYLSATERDAARFRDGWFDTGDVAEIDAEGYVFLRGRADELMNFDGILVAPRDIEAVFEGHPLVAEVVAFAMPSAVHQDVPCIAVVARGEPDGDALLAHGRERLGPKAPRAVLWVSAMPRSAAGKELRRELAALAARAGPR